MSQQLLPPFSLLAPPYRDLLPLADDESFPENPRTLRGAALVWNLASGDSVRHLEQAATRPGGLALLVILPPSSRALRFHERMLEMVETARPHAILPHHPEPVTQELVLLLRQGPDFLPGDVVDYLWWRGLRLDQETRRLATRLVELAGELRTLAAAARGVYLSRRALGRRFRDRGLPPPSRWLQISRLLRAAILLQSTNESLGDIAQSLGYPDAFTLSNQMERMVGVRPSVVRERLGWEWFFESWLRREWKAGNLGHRLSGFPRDGDGARNQARFA